MSILKTILSKIRPGTESSRSESTVGSGSKKKSIPLLTVVTLMIGGVLVLSLVGMLLATVIALSPLIFLYLVIDLLKGGGKDEPDEKKIIEKYSVNSWAKKYINEEALDDHVN